MILTIPDDIQSSLDMNEQELLWELAVALYAAPLAKPASWQNWIGVVSGKFLPSVKFQPTTTLNSLKKTLSIWIPFDLINEKGY